MKKGNEKGNEKSNEKSNTARSKEIFGFMMFDFANSSYTTIIITALFNVYFVSVVVNEANRGELLWSIALSISYLLVVIFGPVFGALADYTGLKKTFLFFTYIICVLFTALLFFVRSGNTLVAMIFVILSNIGYSASENFISSFLPDIANENEMGKISGYAWSFGYIGGLLSLAICLILITFYHPPGYQQSYLPVRLGFLFTAAFFCIAAVPTFLWVKERGERKAVPEGENFFSVAKKRLALTLRSIENFKELVKFLISFFFFNSGISVVIAFAAIFAQKDLGFTPKLTLFLIFVVNIMGALGAFIFGFVEDKLGSKKTILITLIIWVITVSSAYFINDRKVFWICGIFVGIAMGASQSSARALVGLFSPKKKSAEFFGFWGFAGKLSKIFGILSFGIISYIFTSNRFAILSTIFYFFVGIVILLFVNEKRGIENAGNFVDRY